MYLDGFGHFHQRSIGPVSGPVTVFYGPNEAGKSTLLAFIRAILFGFPARFNNHYPPLAGGRHGGRITLSDSAGVIYGAERYAGARGGLNVATLDGPASNAEAVLRRLTGNATPDLFRNVFAFSLDELQAAASLNDSSGTIYSAGQGVPRLPALRKSLSDHKGQIYLSRGNNQEVPRLLNTLRDIDAQLRVIEGNAVRYGGLTARNLEIDLELKAEDAELSQLNARQREIDSLLAAWDDWVALADCEARLGEMPRFEQFPEDPIPRLESFEERARQARDDREEAAERLRQAAEAAAAVIPGEDLLDDEDRIEGIRRARGSFDGSVHDLPERQAELRGMEDSLSDRLRSLGRGWDETNLDALDTSITARGQVDRWNSQLADTSSSAESAQVRLEQDNAQLQDLRSEEQEAQNKLRAGPSGQSDSVLHPASGRLEELLDDREQLERIRRGRSSFDTSVRDLPERRAELNAMESDLGKQLRDFGQGWDEERLERFDTSMVLRQEVGRWKETISGQADAVRQSRQRLEQELTRLTELQAGAREARERLPDAAPPLDASVLSQQQDALRAARGHFNEYERARLNHENLRGQLNSLTGSQESPGRAEGLAPLILPALLAAAGLVLVVAGVYLGEGALLLGLIGGLALLGAGGYYLLARARAAPTPSASPLSAALARQSADAEASAESARLLLVEAAQPLGIGDGPTAATLDSTEAHLESAANDLSAWNEANERAEEAERLVKSQEQRLEAATRQMQDADASDEDARREWQDWLRERGLADGLTPDTMVEFLGRIESTRVKLEQVVQMRHRVSAIQVDIDEYLALVQPVADKYGVALDGSDQQRIKAVADTLIENFDNVRALVVQRDDVARRLKRQEQTVATAAEQQRGASETLAETQERWRGWLRERGLQDSFTPDTMLEFLARVEAARASLTEASRMRDRIAAIKRDIEEFREQVAPLSINHGIPLDPENHRQLAEAADGLIKRLEEAQARHADRERAKEQKEETQRLLDRQEQRLQAVEQELAALLEAGGADDPEVFRQRARQHQERLNLEREQGERTHSLVRLSGPGDKFDAFRESLAASDRNRLNQESGELSERIAEVDSRRNSQREERGGIDNELAQLMGEEESSRLRIHRNTLLEQLQEHAREWSRLTLAEALLEKTRQKFERERQPSVIQHAQGFFSNVTGQRYNRLYAPIGEQTITVMDSTGAGKQPAALSRGTREQLYLALRFGLIREFGEHSERLPVVVDEALVNFDPERARLAAESFAELSQTNQVLVFTCHPATADMFADAAGAHVVDISRRV